MAWISTILYEFEVNETFVRWVFPYCLRTSGKVEEGLQSNFLLFDRIGAMLWNIFDYR